MATVRNFEVVVEVEICINGSHFMI